MFQRIYDHSSEAATPYPLALKFALQRAEARKSQSWFARLFSWLVSR